MRFAVLPFAATFLAVLAHIPATHAQGADPGSIWTISGENDSVSTIPGGSDKYYTSGLRLGWTSGTDTVPAFAASIATAVWGDGITRVSFDINQQIYTPSNTDITKPNPRDRPVAAILAGTFSILQDIGNTRSTLALTAGMIGPSALGRQVQNGFHELIGDRINKGWGSQLPDEPAVELLAERTWRYSLLGAGGIEADVLPSLTVGIGTVRDYAQTGFIFRIGQGLDSDFGVARIRPGISGGDAFTVKSGIPWYVFAGIDGQLVARDAFLDGSIWRRSAHVQHNWLLGEMQAGFAIIWQGVRLSYTQTWQTNSFKGQKYGLFNFGSLTASVKF
jgi:hypothetical protein